MKKQNILLKKATSGLTTDEEIIFQKWLQKSIRNKLLFEKLVLLKKEKEFFYNLSKLDANSAWILVQEKDKQKRKLLFRKKVVKFAVAASVFIFIALNIVNNNTNLFKSTKQTEPIVLTNNIESGTDRAILTLSDGTEVTLNKNSSYTTNTANSDGKQIVYNASSNKNTVVDYNYLTVPRGGQFFIILSDGTQVWLNSETKLKYPTTFIDGEPRIIELMYGEAYFDVSPSKDNKGTSFKVFNKSQEVEVLGTQFNIKAYEDETNILTTLVEGKIVIETNSEKKEIKPNQQSNFNLITSLISIYNVNTKNEIAWKDGVFSFEGKKLDDIMVVLSRWYDTKVIFENKSLEQQKFVGLINKNYSIEDVLTVFKETNIINSYTIDDKLIILK